MHFYNKADVSSEVQNLRNSVEPKDFTAVSLETVTVLRARSGNFSQHSHVMFP